MESCSQEQTCAVLRVEWGAPVGVTPRQTFWEGPYTQRSEANCDEQQVPANVTQTPLQM